MNRGLDIDSAVADGPQSVILPQVTYGIAVRMAVMALILGGTPETGRRVMSLMITGGRLIDPANGIDGKKIFI